MEHSKEKEAGKIFIKDNRSEWVAPEITVLNTNTTAGGGGANTFEGVYYHS